MASTIIRPSATTLSASWALIGAGTAHGALNDSSDATYLQGTTTYSYAQFSLPTFSLTAGTYISRIRIVVRGGSQSASLMATVSASMRVGSSFSNPPTSADTYKFTNVLNTVNGAWRYVNGRGTAWTQSDLDALEVEIAHSTNWGSTVNVTEVWVEVITDTLPTTVVSAPTGTVAYSTKPPTIFSFVDTEGDQMAGYRVKVFTAAQYGAGGFDPETSANKFDSGEVIANVPPPDGVPPTVDLVNGTTYKSYVKVKQLTDHKYGAWTASAAYTQGVTLPPTPGITVATNNFAARVAVEISGGGALVNTPTVNVERSFDNGVTWETVRDPGDITALADPFMMYDYENTPNGMVKYHARFGQIISGYVLYGLFSATTDYVVPNVIEWWLKDPLDPTLNITIDVLRFEYKQEEEQAIYKPLGSQYPVAVNDVIHGIEGIIRLDFLNVDDYTAFKTIRAGQRTLLLQRPFTNEQWYVRLGQILDVKEHLADTTYKVVEIDFVEVAVP